MEIIKRGSLPSERVYEGKCVRCGTEVRFKRVEAKVESHRNEAYVFVKCPVCGSSISVDENNYIKSGSRT